MIARTTNMKFTTPLGVSTNKLYSTNASGRRFKSPIARDFEEEVKDLVKDELRDMQLYGLLLSWRLRQPDLKVTLNYYVSKDYVQTKKGERRKKDFINLEKCQIDTLFEALELDDSLIVELHKKLIVVADSIALKENVPKCEILVEEVE